MVAQVAGPAFAGGGGGGGGVARTAWEWKGNSGWIVYPKDVSDGLAAARLNGESTYTYTRDNGDSYIVTFKANTAHARQARADDPSRVRSVRAPDA